MKKLIFALFGSLLILSACQVANAPDVEDNTTNNEEAAVEETVEDEMQELVFSATEFAYDPSETTVDAGEARIVLNNDGQYRHDLVIENTEYATKIIGSGESDVIEINLEPGTYVFYCSIPGHRTQGMEGTLTVK